MQGRLVRSLPNNFTATISTISRLINNSTDELTDKTKNLYYMKKGQFIYKVKETKLKKLKLIN